MAAVERDHLSSFQNLCVIVAITNKIKRLTRVFLDLLSQSSASRRQQQEGAINI